MKLKVKKNDMKILLYCTHRTGSFSFGSWLEYEIDIPYYQNLNKNYDSQIVKILYDDKIKYKEFLEFFDKIIVLYREDTIAQA